eukprot:Colp12_sorted_trinity150504_noHs@13330
MPGTVCKFFNRDECKYDNAKDCKDLHPGLTCKHWQKGKCLKGDACAFKHPTVLCNSIKKGLDCPHGEKCRFSHRAIREKKSIVRKSVADRRGNEKETISSALVVVRAKDREISTAVVQHSEKASLEFYSQVFPSGISSALVTEKVTRDIHGTTTIERAWALTRK